jgi:hypothetical protein
MNKPTKESLAKAREIPIDSQFCWADDRLTEVAFALDAARIEELNKTGNYFSLDNIYWGSDILQYIRKRTKEIQG